MPALATDALLPEQKKNPAIGAGLLFPSRDNPHGRHQHGQATREAIAMRRYLAALMREARESLTGLQT
jgi:hypothetical protein